MVTISATEIATGGLNLPLDGGQTLRVGPDRYAPERWTLETTRGNSSTVSELSRDGAARLIAILQAGLIDKQAAEIARLKDALEADYDLVMRELAVRTAEFVAMKDRATKAEAALAAMKAERDAALAQVAAMREALSEFLGARTLIGNGPGNAWALGRLLGAWIKASEALSTEGASPTAQGGEGEA